MIWETLHKSKIFTALSDNELQEIVPLFSQLDFEKDQYIFMESDPTDFLYLAARGTVKIIKHTREGKEVILEIKVPGDIFCCAAVLDNKPYPESAQAIGDVSVIRMSRQNLQEIISKYPALQNEFASYASERLKDAHEMFIHIASEKVEKRIAAVLLRLSEKRGVQEADMVKIDLQLTRQEIADMIGATVETCIRAMSRFQKDGIIRTSHHKIYVNQEKLRRYLENP